MNPSKTPGARKGRRRRDGPALPRRTPFCGLAAAMLTATAAGSAAAAPSEWTPQQNTEIEVGLVALGATHNASFIISLFSPPPFDQISDVVGLASDIGIKHLPASLRIPSDFAVFPSDRQTGSTNTHGCVYRFGKRFARLGQAPYSIPEDDYLSGIRAETAAVFAITYDPLDNVWSDLGRPLVQHPQADITVTVRNPFLAPGGYPHLQGGLLPFVLQRPEFPEGRHTFEWEASTSINYVMDVALPGVLLPISAYAESRLARQLAAKTATKNPQKTAQLVFKFVNLARDAGLTAADVSNVGKAQRWYEDTSQITAIIRAQQQLTVWDIHLPYIEDTGNPGRPIQEQFVELEATDFGGVRLGRVQDSLRARFNPVDDCDKTLLTTTATPSSHLLKIGEPNILTWESSEILGGPYRTDLMTLGANQDWIDGGENLVTRLVQYISVVDTQAPILVAPASFARYALTDLDLSGEDFPLGRPRVVDLADPSPSVSNDAPTILAAPTGGIDGIRYRIAWQASDDSGNTTEANAHTQIVTLKAPGTNTPPTASDSQASTLTSRPVEILLTGTDTDLIDGIVDPLEFKIEAQPDRGFFEAPLYPFFIEDFRLTPVGEREEGDNLTRVSPLKHLADAFRLEDPRDHGTFLTDRICDAPAGSLNQLTFNNTIPVDFVFEPSYVHVDDDNFYYIRDKFWVCGEPFRSNFDYRGKINPIPRISKWTEDGELVAMRALYPTDSPEYDNTNLDDNRWPDADFSVDQNGRFWFSFSAIYTFFAQIVRTYSLDSDLGDMRFHGTVVYDEQQLIRGDGLIAVVGDSRDELLYELHANGVYVRRTDPDIDLSTQDGILGVLDLSQIEREATGPFANPENTTLRGSDIKVDSEGNVYVLETSKNRIHKYGPTRRDPAGEWQLGEYIGWMGSCLANKTNPDTGVPYSGCDEDTGTSNGYACTDLTCARAADTAGAGPGQFDAPADIAIDPRDVLYVADTENLRVQRFGPDGTFAGQAESTGTGVNQGAEPGFILGNMGKPRQLSVNSSSFYVMEPDPANGDNFVHVFKTLPFYDLTDSSAKVKYVSRFRFQGQDSFTYITDDGIDQSEPAVVAIDVARAFRKPERLRSQCFAGSGLDTEIPCRLDEDTAIHIRLSAYDPDGFISEGGLDRHDFVILDDPDHGALTLLETQDNSATYRYTPNADFNGADGLVFEVSDGVETSAETAEVMLVVDPVPDPVEITFPDNLTAARGFQRTVTAEFTDVDGDQDRRPELSSLDWGDGVVASGPAWAGSGRRDPNDREISPQVDVGAGSGFLIGSHVYDTKGSYRLRVAMAHHPDEGLADAIAETTLRVIDATIVTAGLTQPDGAVAPEVPFPVNIAVTNLEPEGWSGLTATNTRLSIDVPDGLSMVPTDARCIPGEPIRCDLGDLAADETTVVTLAGFIALAPAREQQQFPIELRLSDDGPKIQNENFAVLTIAIADADSDGVIDVDDAFPDNPRYSADSDGDRLPDAWETRFGYDPGVADDVTEDEDGDGSDLLEELRQGSRPRLADAEAAELGPRLEVADSTRDDRFGIAIAGGDLNRDGYADTVIGAPLHGGRGAMFISYGSADGAREGLAQIGAPEDINSGYGRSVAVGDWDDNGYPDIAVGETSAVYIHYNNGEVLERPDLVLRGPPIFGLFMTSGDLDGDGVDDLIISSSAEIQLYLSTAGGLETTPLVYTPPLPGLGAGADIGDIDGDGAPDLVLGTQTSVGWVYGFLAADNDWEAPTAPVASFVLPTVVGQRNFGFSVATGADITGDGIDDLVVGAYGGTGAINVYDSASGYWIPNPGGLVSTVAPLQSIVGMDDGLRPGDTHGDQLGVRVALGHLDSDPYADVVVGANRAGIYDHGQAQILRGGPAGLAASPQIFDGTTRHDMLGYYVAIPGDVNGDGFADIAVGAPNLPAYPNPVPDGGYVQMLYHAFVAADPAEDTDNDGVRASVDNCPTSQNTDQADLDADGEGDACDSDVDGDGVDNAIDNCPLDNRPGQRDIDGDGQGDICDDDMDGDGVDNPVDICPRRFDPAQSDLDADGEGDACDDDIDGDSVGNAIDVCPRDPDVDQYDFDADGQGDVCDPDDDNDRIPDGEDPDPFDRLNPMPIEALPSRGGWRAILNGDSTAE